MRSNSCVMSYHVRLIITAFGSHPSFPICALPYVGRDRQGRNGPADRLLYLSITLGADSTSTRASIDLRMASMIQCRCIVAIVYVEHALASIPVAWRSRLESVTSSHVRHLTVNCHGLHSRRPMAPYRCLFGYPNGSSSGLSIRLVYT